MAGANEITNEAKLRDYLKRATSDLAKAQRRLEQAEEGEREPIAIVGMGCRYPGGVALPRGAVAAGRAGRRRDLRVPRPTAAGTSSALYDPDPDRARHQLHPPGGFLARRRPTSTPTSSASAPREALAMDPQQRLLLETAWEALEDGGHRPGCAAREPRRRLRRDRCSQDYGAGHAAAVPELEGYLLTGSTTSVVSGRVAYTLGLEGPAVTVDTACSSSLVALHLAAQALRAGECSLALAGGVTVLATPGVFVEFSPPARPRARRALQVVRRRRPTAPAAPRASGVLLLERLSRRPRNGHPVLAVIRGSAVNQDGATTA